jgi:hypothetical protein
MPVNNSGRGKAVAVASTDKAPRTSEIGLRKGSYNSPETPSNRPTAITMAEMPINGVRT